MMTLSSLAPQRRIARGRSRSPALGRTHRDVGPPYLVEFDGGTAEGSRFKADAHPELRGRRVAQDPEVKIGVAPLVRRERGAHGVAHSAERASDLLDEDHGVRVIWRCVFEHDLATHSRLVAGCVQDYEAERFGRREHTSFTTEPALGFGTVKRCLL